MMQTGRIITMLAILAALSTGCGDYGRNGRTPVPRPTAYPRIAVPDSTYTTIEADGIRLTVNDGTDASVSTVDNGAWVNVSYGGYGSPRLYLSVTDCPDPESLAETLANRRERMILNLGSNRYTLTELTTPSGWTCAMAVSRALFTVPVQILAHNANTVLSGAFTLSLPDSVTSNPDPVAIAPLVDVAERDMLVMLKSL